MVASESPPPRMRRPRRTLRAWGVLLLVMFLLTIAVGGSLAAESSYLPITLASHIGLAIATLGLAVFGSAVIAPSYSPRARAAVGAAGLGALGATLAGTIFLLDGQSNPALYAMEGFAIVGVLGSVLTIVFGASSGRANFASPTS